MATDRNDLSADRFTITSASPPLLLLLRVVPIPVRPVTPSCRGCPRSWWKMLCRFDLADGSRRHSNCRPIGFVAHQKHQHHPGELVGDRGDDRSNCRRASRALSQPRACSAASGHPDERPCAMHQLPAQIAVAPLADSEQALLAAGRMLSRCEAKPGGEARPLSNRRRSPAVASTPVATMGPTPGIPLSRRQFASSLPGGRPVDRGRRSSPRGCADGPLPTSEVHAPVG